MTSRPSWMRTTRPSQHLSLCSSWQEHCSLSGAGFASTEIGTPRTVSRDRPTRVRDEEPDVSVKPQAVLPQYSSVSGLRASAPSVIMTKSKDEHSKDD
jgi:hypothetical protein